MKIHTCKSHGHPYTVCPRCGCQYCERTWPVCPRLSWHPAHGVDDADRGRRYADLEQGRLQGERNRAANAVQS